MILEYYGKDTDPDRLNEALKQEGISGFEAQTGNYIFGSLTKLFPDISDSEVKTPNQLTDEQMGEIKNAIDANKPVVCQIDYNPRVVTPTMHFVILVAYNPNDENDFTIVDPLGGKTHSLKDYLGFFHPSARATIEAYSIISGPVPQFTSDTTIPVNKDVFPNLVHGSEQWDKSVAKWLPNNDPKQTPFEDLMKVVGGFQSRATDFSKQLDTQRGDLAEAQQSVIMLKEQLANEEVQRQKDQQTYLAQIDVLKSSGPNIGKLTDVYQGRIDELQAQIKGLLQDKHDISVAKARLQAQTAVDLWQKYFPTFLVILQTLKLLK